MGGNCPRGEKKGLNRVALILPEERGGEQRTKTETAMRRTAGRPSERDKIPGWRRKSVRVGRGRGGQKAGRDRPGDKVRGKRSPRGHRKASRRGKKKPTGIRLGAAGARLKVEGEAEKKGGVQDRKSFWKTRGRSDVREYLPAGGMLYLLLGGGGGGGVGKKSTKGLFLS